MRFWSEAVVLTVVALALVVGFVFGAVVAERCARHQMTALIEAADRAENAVYECYDRGGIDADEYADLNGSGR